MSTQWQHFVFAFCVQLILPLIPLLLEFLIHGTIRPDIYCIVAAMYTISIGVTTKNMAILGIGILSCMVFSCVFGYVLSGNKMYFSAEVPALITIICFMIIHGIERYKRHVKDGEQFIEFGGKSV